MYQSSAATPSGSRSNTPAASAAPAVVTRSTPSAPSPRRRSHSAATAAGASANSAATSGSSTKSFWVPWPLTNLTPPNVTWSGYVPPHPQGRIDVVLHAGRTVQPSHAVVAAKPRPLPAHIATGPDEGAHPRLVELVGSPAGIQRGQHLGV